jgi:Terminase DNA packaging enzyme
MSKFEKSMEKIFDVVPVDFTEKTENKSDLVINQEPVENQLEADLNTDYNVVRKNYEEIIDKGKSAIDDILEIAKHSEHPRAFEVAATLIKNVTEANEKLIGLQKTMREMTKKSSGSGTTIDKAIFVGSTAELSKFLKNKSNE